MHDLKITLSRTQAASFSLVSGVKVKHLNLTAGFNTVHLVFSKCLYSFARILYRFQINKSDSKTFFTACFDIAERAQVKLITINNGSVSIITTM